MQLKVIRDTDGPALPGKEFQHRGAITEKALLQVMARYVSLADGTQRTVSPLNAEHIQAPSRQFREA